MSNSAGGVPVLTVTTQAVDDIRPLIPLVDPRHPLVFIRRGQGIAGLGEALRLEFRGPDRMREAADTWRRVAAAARVTDELGIPGTGLVALGAFAFADDSTATSVLIVPSVVIGRRDGVSWITRVDCDSALPAATPAGAEFRLGLRPGSLDAAGYTSAVESALQHLRAHELSKVVLARDLVGHLPDGADLRLIVAELALGYPDCWTFAVDGLIGSSPETLVRADHGTVTARVLAGSAARGVDALSDQDAAARLATSTKDLDEHHFALESLMTSLRPHARTLIASELPFTLKLPNLWHLASDIEGTLTDGSSSLDLIAALHPTAAVAGTPTSSALALIAELEPFDRGRYAGPVGWVGADGDGEWAVALRSAQVDDSGDITAWAGAGIVADSDPEKELAETRMKFRPIVEAFG
ncbi:isochorismate synthase [Galbitalea soli]|uniref:isochorismate synthase n=1 Tax=Galbitalea soli TaxID=1268042 RepID=UPI0017C87478|nr:menaquinone-specific isochorismate synthase [Galbitalea soli]